MKQLLVIGILALLFAACGGKGESPAKTVAPPVATVNADSAAISEALRGFFKWYTANQEAILAIDVVDGSGKVAKISEPGLQQYLALFQKSGFVSSTFLENETKFYRACAKVWAENKEDPEELLSGMDADRFLCSQEEDIDDLGNSAVVSAKITGDQAAAQIVAGKNGALESPLKFDLKKENGRWLLAKVGCDVGIVY